MPNSPTAWRVSPLPPAHRAPRGAAIPMSEPVFSRVAASTRVGTSTPLTRVIPDREIEGLSLMAAEHPEADVLEETDPMAGGNRGPLERLQRQEVEQIARVQDQRQPTYLLISRCGVPFPGGALAQTLGRLTFRRRAGLVVTAPDRIPGPGSPPTRAPSAPPSRYRPWVRRRAGPRRRIPRRPTAPRRSRIGSRIRSPGPGNAVPRPGDLRYGGDGTLAGRSGSLHSRRGAAEDAPTPRGQQWEYPQVESRRHIILTPPAQRDLEGFDINEHF